MGSSAPAILGFPDESDRESAPGRPHRWHAVDILVSLSVSVSKHWWQKSFPLSIGSPQRRQAGGINKSTKPAKLSVADFKAETRPFWASKVFILMNAEEVAEKFFLFCLFQCEPYRVDGVYTII